MSRPSKAAIIRARQREARKREMRINARMPRYLVREGVALQTAPKQRWCDPPVMLPISVARVVGANALHVDGM